jgi:UDP-N-acetylmuramyl pentapeptide phosphotransferase/UDP-N-acetylglucosamine-1-phosphate transferase
MIGVVAIAAAVAFCITLLIALSKDWHGHFSMDHDLSGVQKFHLKPVPRVGGLALFFGILFALALCHTYTTLLPAAFNAELASTVLYASSPVFLAGLIEDTTKKVSIVVRLTAAFVSALLASWLLGATLSRIDIWGVDQLMVMAPFALAVTMVVVAGGVNAMNIIDGFNGLAGGTALIILAGFGILSWEADDMFVTYLVLLGMGATLGFLLINYPTGRVFLGDGGAYFLGFWISEIAVLLLVRNPSINAWQVLAVCAYPIIEVLFSIYRRKVIRKSSPGQPDCLHLHTLVYRRVVCQLLPSSVARPWLRNALVVWFVGALIALMTTAAVLFGESLSGAIMVVIGEVLVYIAMYARVVRGRWITVPTILLRWMPGARADVK